MGASEKDQERHERSKQMWPVVKQIVLGNPQEGEFVEVPALLGDLVLKTYSRVRALLEGIGLLLQAGLPEEAMFLLRSMLSDSLMLMELEANPSRREAMALWWMNESVSRLEGLGRESQAVGLDRAGDWGPGVAKLRSNIEKYRNNHQIRRLVAVRDERQLARDHGLAARYWDFKLMSEMIHRADLAVGSRTRKLEDGVFRMDMRNMDPGQLAAVSVSAMEWALRALKAVASIFEWKDVSIAAVDALLNQLDSIFEDPVA